MSPERREKVRHAWGNTLTFIRNWLAIAFAILFALAGTHARMFDEEAMNGWEFSTCVLASFTLFGWHGLQLYREVKRGDVRQGEP